jgi:hypothetical protein
VFFANSLIRVHDVDNFSPASANQLQRAIDVAIACLLHALPSRTMTCVERCKLIVCVSHMHASICDPMCCCCAKLLVRSCRELAIAKSSEIRPEDEMNQLQPDLTLFQPTMAALPVIHQVG